MKLYTVCWLNEDEELEKELVVGNDELEAVCKMEDKLKNYNQWYKGMFAEEVMSVCGYKILLIKE